MSHMTDLQNKIFRPNEDGKQSNPGKSAKSGISIREKVSDEAVYNSMTDDQLRNEAVGAQEAAIEILEFGRSKAIKEAKHSPLKKSSGSPGAGLGMARTGAMLERQRAAEKQPEKAHTVQPPSRLPPSMEAPGGFGVAQHADDRMNAATNLLQNKYEQNVKVVEMLFDEKKALEEKIASLEQLVSGSGMPTPSITGGTFDEQVAAAKRVASPERLGAPQRASSPKSKGRKGSTTARTARSMSAGTKRPSPDKPGASSLGAAAAAELFGGHKSAKSLRQSQFVLQLQADSDRYLQKKKAAEEKERQKRKDAEAYEQEKYKRLVRANKAEPFTAMMERAEKADAINKERAIKKQREKEEKERKEEAARRKKRIDHINKARPSGELTWKEMEEAATAARIERVEKRKVEMSMSSKAPGMSDQASRRREPKVEKYEPKPVEAPEMVASRLARQQKKWDAKIEEIKFRNAQKARIKQSSIDPKVLSMENRIKQTELKKKARQDEKDRLEQEKQERLAETKRRELEKLMNQKVPEASRRLTKSAENRAILVRQKAEAEMRAAEAEAKEERERQNKLKAMSAVMKSVVAERESFRKSQHGDYRELAGSEERAAQVAREKRAEFREKMRKNKERLKEARDKAPTLMQRMDMNTAAARAGSDALNTIKNAFEKGMGDDGDDDDLFDDFEKMKLGLA